MLGADWLDEQNEKENKQKLAREKRSEEEKTVFLDRYSLDYNRWNESNYVPSDPASKVSERALRKTRILAIKCERNGYRHNGYIHFKTNKTLFHSILLRTPSSLGAGRGKDR
tara:strand:+ start:53 stop:388 length:336 start_codon:yes stop_codon:yes gene_type:complete